MNKLALLLALCVACAVLRAALAALVVVLMIALLWSFVTRPRETLILLSSLALMALAEAHPLAFIVALGFLGVAVVVMGSRRKPLSGPLLLQQEPKD